MAKWFLIIVGIILSAIGLIVPIPGPADDPVDYIGYIMTILGMLQSMFKNKR